MRLFSPLPRHDQESLRIVSCNVNGIRSAHNKGFLDWLEQDAPDILCLQEIRATCSQMPQEVASPFGYHAYWNSSCRAGYSGTAIYSRQKPHFVVRGLGCSEIDKEGRVIIAEYGELRIVNCYVPNGNSGSDRLSFKLRFFDELCGLCDRARSERRPTVICGDFNVAHTPLDLSDPSGNARNSGFLPEERERLERLIATGFHDTLRRFFPDIPEMYTWWSYARNSRERNRGWRFDYCFASEELLADVLNAYILDDIRFSDHCPIGITIRRKVANTAGSCGR